MCVTSMVGDHYRDYTFPNKTYWPKVEIWPGSTPPATPAITRAEFDDLKKTVLEMKELLLRAKTYDEKNNEPNCEMEEKVELLKKVAKLVGVDLSEIFGNG